VPNKEEIQTRSEKANEILGTPPHFVIRSGIGLIMLMLIIFLSTSLIIEYPDFIKARITITGGSSPVSIVAKKMKSLNIF
jgi:hypothetical protein